MSSVLVEVFGIESKVMLRFWMNTLKLYGPILAALKMKPGFVWDRDSESSSSS